MATYDDVTRWIRRTADAATEATLRGATADDIQAAINRGIAQAHHELALRDATGARPNVAQPATTSQPEPFVPEPGSAIEAFLKAIG